MSAPMLYFFDWKNGELTSSRTAQKRPNGKYILDVQGATSVAPPDVPEGYVPCWNGEVWELKEDHRQKRDKGGVIIEGSGTPYWLEEDDWRSPARYLDDVGPLPENALLEKPAKPEAEVAREERRARMVELETWFRNHDYIGVKIATGRATPEDYAEEITLMKQHAEDINYDDARKFESEVRHDVMAHVKAYGKLAPKAMPIIHLGATSCYVTDNAEIIVIDNALDIVLDKLINFMDKLRKFALKYKDLPTLGFTHLQPAQLTTVGKRATLWLSDLLLDLENLKHLKSCVKLRGVKGTTGTQASFLTL